MSTGGGDGDPGVADGGVTAPVLLPSAGGGEGLVGSAPVLLFSELGGVPAPPVLLFPKLGVLTPPVLLFPELGGVLPPPVLLFPELGDVLLPPPVPSFPV